MKQEVIEASRVLFTRPRAQVEERLNNGISRSSLSQGRSRDWKRDQQAVKTILTPRSETRTEVRPETRPASVRAEVRSVPAPVSAPAPAPASAPVARIAPVVSTPVAVVAPAKPIGSATTMVIPAPKPAAIHHAPVPSSPSSAFAGQLHQSQAKPISLSQLKSKTTPDSQTGPLKENISALRQALASAMKKDPNDISKAAPRPLAPPTVATSVVAPSAAPVQVAKKEPVAPIAPSHRPAQTIQEIPENELRRLLEVEK